MLITDTIFAAFLNCETKSHFILSKTPTPDDKYSVFRYSINDEYKQQCSVHLRSNLPDIEYLENLSFEEACRTGTFRFAFDCIVQAGKLQTRPPVLERLPLDDKKNAYDLIPIRCFPNKNISRTDKLLLAFDALVLSVASGRMPPYGKIIHGSPAKTVKVQLPGLMKTVENTVRKIASHQLSSVAPETVLKSHCVECEFQSRCRREATEKDSLSLFPASPKRKGSGSESAALRPSLSSPIPFDRKESRRTFRRNRVKPPSL
jgi:predicted RecB family nuclease